MSVVLIGYRGSGKSTVGKRLADRLWQTFVDTDDLIVRKAGKSIREIFEQQGEAAFRDLESTIVRDTLMLQEHVISLGGGALLREENRAALKASGHKVVYLKCAPEELYRRISEDPDTAADRPNLTADGGLEEVKNLLAAREPTYRAAMSAELDVTHLSPQDAVVYIVRLL
jgi:shikimate kinase